MGRLSRSNWNLEVLVFEEREKPEYPEKNLSFLLVWLSMRNYLTLSILNITLQKVYHVIRIRAWTEEPALMNQEEATAVSARADSVVKHVMAVRAVYYCCFMLLWKNFSWKKKHYLKYIAKSAKCIVNIGVNNNNPIWSSDFSEFPLDAKSSCCISTKDSLWWLDGCISDMP